ncbi:MAG: VOC family protein [Acidimicrobiia bacterium]|jgi:predicted 3-demethylubiquinone-9 3-methyltransferase (glyoxalase superfamily)|nr:VOC family protein [Acidimicrobiia bacterium]
MDQITPCLWFDGNGLEAAEFYVGLFPDSAIVATSPGPDGGPLVINFTLMGRPFQALNGGPNFVFNEAVSMSVPCDDQAEVDRLWDALLDGGQEAMCGWVKDRFGLWWQVVPKDLGQYLGDPDPARAARATEALMSMQKIDLSRIKAAADSAT